MILQPECVGCIFNQVLKAFRLLKPDIERETIVHAQKKVMEYLIPLDFDEISAPIVGGFTYSLVAELLDLHDPYKELKQKYNDLALRYYDEVKEVIQNTADPLFEALAAAALGNTVDFASQHKIDLVKDIKEFSPDNLKINDYAQFQKSLKNYSQILILGDNCGEIVFDKLLVETLQELYPDLEIIYAVRSKPIINDSTIEDAQYIGLTDLVKVIEISPVPGVDLSRATEEFKKYFYSEENFILSKGQGNFECLYGMEVPNKEIFYLLKAKCPLMERIFGVPVGSLIFKEKTKNF